MDPSILADIGNLVVAALLSGAIGLERQVSQKAAGFRTHMLVGAGAGLFTILSINGFPDPSESSRVAAQIVTGIGFLGAGAIFREGANVRGLTTAAGLWAVAAIGMAAGAGQVILAVAATALVLLVLFMLRGVDAYLIRKLGRAIATVEVVLDDAGAFSKVWKTATRLDPLAHDVAFERRGDAGGVMRMDVAADKAETLAELLVTQEGVARAEVIE